MMIMHTLSVLLSVVPGAGADPPQAPASPVRVVATLPVYASIVTAIGGTEVDVSSIADPREDAHFVRPKPSFAADIRRADLFITTGLDLELWVPALLDRAGNARVSEGGPGYVTAYSGVQLLDVPTAADRAAGDIHVYGNPHVFTDPLNAIQIARNITIGLKKVAPDRSATWDAGLATFTKQIHEHLFGARLVELLGGDQLAQLAISGKLDEFLRSNQFEGAALESLLGGWLGTARAFRGKEVICYHKNWAYFEHRFQVKCVDYVEAKPGIPPTPGHVASLIRTMQSRNIHVLMAAEYFGRDKVKTVADRANAGVVMMPLGTGSGNIRTYSDLVDAWVNGLGAAFTAGT